MMNINEMGCGSSSGVSGGSSPGSLTPKEQELIKMSWTKFKEGDVVAEGAHLYYKLFETNPEAKDYFGFAKDQEVNLDNRQFKAHVKKVYDVVGSAVDGSNDLPNLLPMLHELGVRHKSYGVPPKYYKVIGTSLIYALDRSLKMDSNTKHSWARLYSVIECEMMKGMA